MRWAECVSGFLACVWATIASAGDGRRVPCEPWVGGAAGGGPRSSVCRGGSVAGGGVRVLFGAGPPLICAVRIAGNLDCPQGEGTCPQLQSSHPVRAQPRCDPPKASGPERGPGTTAHAERRLAAIRMVRFKVFLLCLAAACLCQADAFAVPAPLLSTLLAPGPRWRLGSKSHISVEMGGRHHGAGARARSADVSTVRPASAWLKEKLLSGAALLFVSFGAPPPASAASAQALRDVHVNMEHAQSPAEDRYKAGMRAASLAWTPPRVECKMVSEDAPWIFRVEHHHVAKRLEDPKPKRGPQTELMGAATATGASCGALVTAFIARNDNATASNLLGFITHGQVPSNFTAGRCTCMICVCAVYSHIAYTYGSKRIDRRLWFYTKGTLSDTHLNVSAQIIAKSSRPALRLHLRWLCRPHRWTGSNLCLDPLPRLHLRWLCRPHRWTGSSRCLDPLPRAIA